MREHSPLVVMDTRRQAEVLVVLVPPLPLLLLVVVVVTARAMVRPMVVDSMKAQPLTEYLPPPPSQAQT